MWRMQVTVQVGLQVLEWAWIHFDLCHTHSHTPRFSLWCKTQRLAATPGQMDALHHV